MTSWTQAHQWKLAARQIDWKKSGPKENSMKTPCCAAVVEIHRVFRLATGFQGEWGGLWLNTMQKCLTEWLGDWVVPLCVSAAAAPICRWLFWPPFYSSPLHTDAGCCPCWCWGWVLHSPGLSSTSWLPKTQAPLRNTKQPSNCHSHGAGWQQTAEKSDSLWKKKIQQLETLKWFVCYFYNHCIFLFIFKKTHTI